MKLWDGNSYEDATVTFYAGPDSALPADHGAVGDFIHLAWDGDAPGAPQGLTSLAGDTQVALDWNDNVEEDLDRYEYRYGPDGGALSAWTSTGLTSSVTVTGLTNGQAYDFEVRAVDTSGNASTAAADTETPAAGFDPLTGVGWEHAYWTGDPSWTPPADGSTAQTWPDGVGAADLVQATSANRPTYRAASASMNSKPILEFRTDDSMAVAFTQLTQPTSLVIVGRYNALAAGATIVGGDDGTHRNQVFVDVSSNWNINAGASVAGSAADTTKHLLRARFNGASSALFEDETSVVSGNAGAEVLDGLRVALNAGGSAFADVDIAFIGVYEGDVTADPGWANFKDWVENTEYAIALP